MMTAGDLIAVLELYDSGKEVLVKDTFPEGRPPGATFRLGDHVESFEDVVLLHTTGPELPA